MTKPQNPSQKTPAHKRFEPRQKRKAKKITEQYLHNSGLYYLQRYAASAAHFRTVMLRKVKKSCLDHPDQNYDTCAILVDALVEKFINAGLLNDTLYIESHVRSLRQRGLSKRAIIAKMKTKGIAAETTQDALEHNDLHHHESPQDAERYAVAKHIKKKSLGPYNKNEKLDFNKMIGRLGRAGFSYDTSRSVLEMSIDEIEDILHARKL